MHRRSPERSGVYVGHKMHIILGAVAGGLIGASANDAKSLALSAAGFFIAVIAGAVAASR